MTDGIGGADAPRNQFQEVREQQTQKQTTKRTEEITEKIQSETTEAVMPESGGGAAAAAAGRGTNVDETA